MLCIQPLAYTNIPFKPNEKQKIVIRANRTAQKEKEAVVQYQVRSTSSGDKKIGGTTSLHGFSHRLSDSLFLHLIWTETWGA